MTLLLLLWILFFFSHSFLAAEGVKQWVAQRTGNFFRWYRVAYNLFSLMLLAAILYILLIQQTPCLVFVPDAWIVNTGWALMFGGTAIVILAFANYDLREFTGIRQLAQQIHHPETLVIKGLNQWMRHPLYTGLLLFIAGWFLQQPSQMNLVSAIALYLYIYTGAKLEEQKLTAVFGDAYLQYAGRVKMFVPYVF